jgi:transmembrane sensor
LSGQHQENILPSAIDVRARAAEWLAKRVSEDWDGNQQIALDAWLAESPAHRIAYLRVNGAWSHTSRLAALRVPSPVEIGGSKRLKRATGRVVAILVLAIIVSASGAAYFLTAGDKTYTTQIGDHKIVALNDGSQVELNTDTTLRVSANAGTVTLVKGEAFFQIKHDASRLFRVIIGNHRITDLGTKFLVRSDPNRLEVALVEGRARLESSATGASAQSAILVSGDVAVATAGSLSVTKEVARRVKAELGWQRGVLIFDSTPLAEAAAEFNRYNEKKLIVRDASVARFKIDGTFPIKNVGQFTEVAQAVFGLHVSKLDDETVISR